MNARDDNVVAAKPFVGRRTMGALERARIALDPVTSRLLGPTVSDADAATAGMNSFEREADTLISRQRTRGAQKIVRAAAIAVAALVAWAALATVDEVTRGDARVIPSRQLQVTNTRPRKQYAGGDDSGQYDRGQRQYKRRDEKPQRCPR